MKKHTILFKQTLWIIVVIFISVPFLTFSQKKPKKHKDEDKDADHQWDYTIDRNTPDAVAPLTFLIDPFLPSVSDEIGVAAQVKADIKVADRFDVSARVLYYYLGTFTNADNPVYTPSPFPAQSQYEVGGSWFFSDEAVNKDEDVLLYSESVGYRSYINHMTKIPMDHQQKFGLRAAFGYAVMGTSQDLGDISGYNQNDPTKTPFKFYSANTNTNFGFIAVGLSSEKIRDYKVHFQNGQIRQLSRKVTWYADLLFSPFASYSNVSRVDSGGTYIITNTPKSNLGFRIGFNIHSLKVFGGNGGFELADMPGSQTGQFYFRFNLGFAISPQAKD